MAYQVERVADGFVVNGQPGQEFVDTRLEVMDRGTHAAWGLSLGSVRATPQPRRTAKVDDLVFPLSGEASRGWAECKNPLTRALLGNLVEVTEPCTVAEQVSGSVMGDNGFDLRATEMPTAEVPTTAAEWAEVAGVAPVSPAAALAVGRLAIGADAVAVPFEVHRDPAGAQTAIAQ